VTTLLDFAGGMRLRVAPLGSEIRDLTISPWSPVWMNILVLTDGLGYYYVWEPGLH
jgi:hypothetical protein